MGFTTRKLLFKRIKKGKLKAALGKSTPAKTVAKIYNLANTKALKKVELNCQDLKNPWFNN